MMTTMTMNPGNYKEAPHLGMIRLQWLHCTCPPTRPRGLSNFSLLNTLDPRTNNYSSKYTLDPFTDIQLIFTQHLKLYIQHQVIQVYPIAKSRTFSLSLLNTLDPRSNTKKFKYTLGQGPWPMPSHGNQTSLYSTSQTLEPTRRTPRLSRKSNSS